MSRPRRAGGAKLAAAALTVVPAAASAHAFGERYDLPAPLSYFVAGATATVALSFVVAVLIPRSAARSIATDGAVIGLGRVLPLLRGVARTLAVALLFAAMIAGWFGSRNPEANLAPTLVWIVGWMAMSLVVACIGNVWTALDPWRAIFDTANALARRCGAPNGIALGWNYPAGWSAWPAVALLLVLAWLEMIYLQASVPSRIALMLLVWSIVTLGGMTLFGAASWQRNADVFSIYFATLGRFAPMGATGDGRSIALRPFGRALIEPPPVSNAMVAFVTAMLATVLFDGLIGGQLWWLTQRVFTRWIPGAVDDGGYRVGTFGLVAVWVIFLSAYWLACAITARVVGGVSTGAIGRLFALTLVPIAVAYQLAHNFSSIAIQGQLLLPLASDPFGRGWDLFGTAASYPDIGIVDARLTWYVAIGAIVTGHVISVWLAHRLALRELDSARSAAIASIPLTILMVIYTAISLSVIAEPLVQFRGGPA